MRGRKEQESAESLVIEVRSVEQVYEVLSGLLDGVESAEETAVLLADGRSRREEMERIRRRYTKRTGEELMFEWTAGPLSVERGRVVVLPAQRPGETAFGIVVSALEVDGRLKEYMWSRNVPFRTVDGGAGGEKRVVDTAFGRVEFVAPRFEGYWPNTGGRANYDSSGSCAK